MDQQEVTNCVCGEWELVEILHTDSGIQVSCGNCGIRSTFELNIKIAIRSWNDMIFILEE